VYKAIDQCYNQQVGKAAFSHNAQEDDMASVKNRTIVIKSYNPHSARYPNYKVITRETLHFIKYLRERGYIIIVDADDGRKLNYLAEKGIREFLSDPIIALVLNTPLSLITNLVSNWLYDEWKRRFGDRELNEEEIHIVLEYNRSGKIIRYNHRGKKIDERKFMQIVDTLVTRMHGFNEVHLLNPPQPEYRYPVTLEHTPYVVGWAGQLIIDNEGLKVNDLKITDDETRKRVKNKELIGLSIGGIVINSICSICQEEYVNCNHISGKTYENNECVVEITGIRLAEFSIVSDPVNPQTLIQMIR